MRFGSLFAGVGGFDLGMEAAGWSCAWQVEWDRHCQAVLARHWPAVPRWGDVRDVDGRTLPPVECITFGSPCQDLSVAGNRAGLNGARSSLFFDAVRIIKEMRDATGDALPRWAIWENVAGALSSHGGADFGVALDTLADAGALVVEWAVLDARRFGVPQRRRRVFVVACLDPRAARACPDPLLPVATRGSRHPGASATEGAHVAALTANGVGTCGPDDNQAQAGHLIAFDHVTTLTTRAGATYDDQQVGQLIPVAFDSTRSGRNPLTDDGLTPTVKVGSGVGIAVRRLTPVECERLMGWPDDHTRWTADGTEIADSHRYRMCGNGVAAPVAAWVGRQIAGVEVDG